MFETNINGLSGVKNGEIGPKMSILALLSLGNMVILPILGGFVANFGAPRAQFRGNR